ncbi:ribosomal protein S18-alanine N-acetyltransferase [Methylotuvimicrobium alcaliphilum]|uniref:[Ribosomal protein bS18]-alanine N-acetyltransferase n=1 Tax=Methylotuvimicrobium alcaliphilum (strain DSM 19304 / NCIMB 14124 / VKM B-2133 / 20Z) TaxID=1091494 RepID=G4STH6_META2|nr:ribosomal protein S18-alanine N-acetyltransferase [Methylotuvimicrobium alcaliphilum]CCE24974.1 Ribosomal-protein-alanine acetyltransferase [Methylotuvimicrobium alcaliphilum 20Z]
MRELLQRFKDIVVYDADREFYAKIFPDSVTRDDLLRMRRMTGKDLSAVLAIENTNYDFPWSEGVFKDCFKAGYSCWVCEDVDRILGYSIVSIAVGEAHILNISVASEEQGQGIGRKMLTHLIEVARWYKTETIFLEVRPSNSGAIALYEKTGFNEIGIRKDYYPAQEGREDALMLALELFY